MSRPLVQAHDISFSYGAQRVFDHAKFILPEGEKIAIVGPNGAGKSTLFKILMGDLKPEDPKGIEVARDLRVGYMPQIHTIEGDRTGLEVLRVPSTEERRLESRIAGFEAWMAQPDAWDDPEANEKMAQYGELQERLVRERSKASGTTSPLLGELGVEPESLDTRFDALSGGQKTKILLARALANARELDLIILDEPTNHLDIDTVEWVEAFLMDLKGTVLLAAHDRWLLDNIATGVFEVAGRSIGQYEGNYSSYRDQKAAIKRAWDAKKKRDHAELKRQLRIIDELKRRNRFDSQVKSRKTRLMDNDSKSAGAARPDDKEATGADPFTKVIKLEFKAGAKHSQDVLTVENVRKSWDGRPIISDVTFEVRKDDKLALIGPNGCGKTTLLSMLAGRHKPDGGIIQMSPGVRMGYFAQEHEGLDANRTVLDEMRSSRGDSHLVPEAEARAMLGRFLFTGEESLKTCDVLSGGERARLALAKFILAECNLLLLDEPTNHLDLPSQEVVQSALAQFPGSIVVVSHDRSFLDAVCNKVAFISGGRVGVFAGKFSDTWTMNKLQEFAQLEAKARYKVVRGFQDWEADRRYIVGDIIGVTGMETQGFKRLMARAIDLSWVEPVK